MADVRYLSKRLVGIEESEDGSYATGKLTGCVTTLVEGFLAVSCCNFVRVSSHAKGASKRLKSGQVTKSSILFSQKNSAVPIPYTGYPFEVIATEKWVCNETSPITKKQFDENSHNSKKRRIEDHDCGASMQFRTVRIYTEYGLPKDNSLSESDLKKAKDSAKEGLITAINSGEKVKWADIHYCRFPLASAHNHDARNTRCTVTQLDKRVTNKIRELAKSGIYDIHGIKSMVYDFVCNTLFAHAEEEEKPKPDNRRYFPTTKAIRNHIFLAVGNVKNIPGYCKRKTHLEDTYTPSITNILEIPIRSDKLINDTEQHGMGVGFIAIHAGAGYHSEERWPGYKLLCKTVCSEVSKRLKLGLRAGQAATLAVKLLEDSELTNAGLGSNLTENGQVECDASVMDSSQPPDMSNRSDCFYGSVACVSKVKNPVCAAYEVLNAQRTRSRLELGRIPPSFLVSEGAENWSRAHGVEMCEPEDLISESAFKSWQKYHRKLLEKLSRSNTEEKEYDESAENLKKRLDTVGAVVLDLEGNVAAAVSSGGLILKMPGRVGQAALYGCGCWAEPSGINTPAVAVTTSGCGEQLVSTMLAKKCAENLRSREQPYQALQETLVKDFLGSTKLDLECDKQAGLLCLHYTNDRSNCTVEVVWGHTTSSMVIGHMSTNDSNPKIILSRLPDNASPGKSVTVGGSWTKVACSDKIEMHPDCSEDFCSSQSRKTNSTDQESFQDADSIPVDVKDDTVLKTFDGLPDIPCQNNEIDPDISIMFASPLPEGLPALICKVKLSEEYNRKVDPEFEKSINERWKQRLTQNARLFNAQKFRVHSVEYETGNGSPQFAFCLGLTCYRDYMETNWAKEVAQLKEKGLMNHSDSQAYLADPLGVAAIVVTEDREAVFQWRNSWLAEGAGMLDVPGGHPEPSEVAGVNSRQFVNISDLRADDIVEEIFNSQVKEVRDEVNVPLEKIGQPILTGLVRNHLSGGRPVAYFYMRIHMKSEEILRRYNEGGPETDESTKLEFISEEDIQNLRQQKPELWSKMCPNGKAACTLYAMLKKEQAKSKPPDPSPSAVSRPDDARKHFV